MLSQRFRVLLREARLDAVAFAPPPGAVNTDAHWPLVVRTAQVEVYAYLLTEGGRTYVVPVVVDRALPVPVRLRRGYPPATCHLQTIPKLCTKPEPSLTTLLSTLITLGNTPETRRVWNDEGLGHVLGLCIEACRQVLAAWGACPAPLVEPLNAEPPPPRRTAKVWTLSAPPQGLRYDRWNDLLLAQAQRASAACVQALTSVGPIGGAQTLWVGFEPDFAIKAQFGTSFVPRKSWGGIMCIEAADIAEPTSEFWRWRADSPGDWLRLSLPTRTAYYYFAPLDSPSSVPGYFQTARRGNLDCWPKEQIIRAVGQATWQRKLARRIQDEIERRAWIAVKEHLSVAGMKDALAQRPTTFAKIFGVPAALRESMVEVAAAMLKERLTAR